MLKRAAGAFLAAAVIASGAAGNCCSLNTFAADSYTSWSQLDERWSGISLAGTYTIGNSGCLITSLSIMAMHSGSIDDAALKNLGISDVSDFNPGVLAKAYTARGGFNQWGGIASWGTISQIIPSVTFITDSHFKSADADGIAAEIKELMASGQHIIMNVNGHHWVYVEGVADGEIYMFDPACDVRVVTDYYTLAGCNEYWALKGKNPAPPVDMTGVIHKEEIEPAEYFCTAATADVYSDVKPENRLFTLNCGDVVTVSALADGMAELTDSYGETIGWTSLDALSAAGDEPELAPGDINGDGCVDEIDLALLNDYLSAAEARPEGVSVLRKSEAAAADLNGDGTADRGDVAAYLSVICG
ncbi:MAG: dockerin type I repeat-containing protein [Ruminococcus sp.]|nr:dockerin type I repeat-containing protein [Ruminococcus sp.]